MSRHVTELLALAAARTLDPAEQVQLEAHLSECAACAEKAAEWRRLGDGLAHLPVPRASRALTRRTLELVERRLAERADRAWNQAALAFAIALSWTLAVVAWLVLDVVVGGLTLSLNRPLGSTAAWYVAYVVLGWLAAGAAAVLLGQRARAEGRTA